MSEKISEYAGGQGQALATRTQIIPYRDMVRMAETIAQSGLFGMKNATEVLALMLVAQSEGRHPASVALDYHIIQGRPALRADAMLARFQERGGVVEWVEMTDQRVVGRFSHPVSCPTPVEVDWDLERATKAGLTDKENWRRYPRAMLRARVISEGVRAALPIVNRGVYVPEEVGDFDDAPEVTVSDARSADVALTASPQSGQAEEAPACPECGAPMGRGRKPGSTKGPLWRCSRAKREKVNGKWTDVGCRGVYWHHRDVPSAPAANEPKPLRGDLPDETEAERVAWREEAARLKTTVKALIARVEDAWGRSLQLDDPQDRALALQVVKTWEDLPPREGVKL